MISKAKTFFTEVAVEMKKVSWLNRQELIDSTKVVLVSSFLLGFFIAATDFVLSKLVGIFIS